VYASYFDGQFPARSTVAVNALPMAALVEIEMVALIKNLDSSEEETPDIKDSEKPKEKKLAPKNFSKKGKKKTKKSTRKKKKSRK
jgi:hypothetical protein